MTSPRPKSPLDPLAPPFDPKVTIGGIVFPATDFSRMVSNLVQRSISTSHRSLLYYKVYLPQIAYYANIDPLPINLSNLSNADLYLFLIISGLSADRYNISALISSCSRELIRRNWPTPELLEWSFPQAKDQKELSQQVEKMVCYYFNNTTEDDIKAIDLILNSIEIKPVTYSLHYAHVKQARNVIVNRLTRYIKERFQDKNLVAYTIGVHAIRAHVAHTLKELT